MKNKRELKNSIYIEISRIAKAISNPNRLEILDFIANGAKSVEDIALQTGISIANASQHLQTLKKERLVKTSKKGNHVFYALVSMEVYVAWKSLRDLTLSVNPHVKQTITEIRDNFEYENPLTLNELNERKDIYLLDVRPIDEYEKGHIPNAISIPIEELKTRLEEIPKDKLVIAYCRGMFCLVADEAVKVLHSNGYNAKKIEESVLDYQMANELLTIKY
ncbi:MAG TPA: metalloregulator ArsR/SmtB family transcription factor [Gillisia sp.]|nr:metalloregulator ArsR/SmtB family transcription factor [Gillisia sp.]